MTDAPDAPPAITQAPEPDRRAARARPRQTPVPGQTDAQYGRFRPGWIVQTTRRIASALPPGQAGLRLAGALAPAALSGLKDEAADVQVLGLSLRLHPRDTLSEKRAFLTPQCFDPHELDALRAVMGPGKTFVDAGAHAGLYALVAAQAGGPACRVIAVEPRHRLRRRLAFNARQNDLSRIEISGVALADYEGERLQRILHGAPGQAAASGGEAVRVTTLATLMDEMRVDRVHALKIDAGDAEASVLGAFFAHAAPARWPDLIILKRASSDSASGPDAAGLARSRGYRIEKTTRIHHILKPATG
ncbi:MAG: FkbM family methyltransferase [Oceanicaulis sp.]|nr:FkbM family methyltransferase [Oceanicaulis sp.]